MSDATAESAADLDPEVRKRLHDLILVLADSKRLLGMRYADWILGAPELEAGIACASMAQDEWGHARLTYALLKDFDVDIDRLEHGREPGEYRAMVVLDRQPESWPELVAVNALVDGALTEQFEALRDSSYLPIRQRCEKLLEEERFHAAHAAAWTRRLAHAGEESKVALREAFARILPAVLAWFGPGENASSGDPGGSSETSPLERERMVSAEGDPLRRAFRDRVRPLFEELDGVTVLDEAVPAFEDFDPAARRPREGGPDVETIRRIRGDRNRALLVD